MSHFPKDNAFTLPSSVAPRPAATMIAAAFAAGGFSWTVIFSSHPATSHRSAPTRWLIPRLADFQKREPEIEVRFATGGATLPYNDDWTCGIRLGGGNWPGFVAERLFAADLTPVCSSAMAARLKTLEDLKTVPLLRVAHASDDWPRWFKAAGLTISERMHAKDLLARARIID